MPALPPPWLDGWNLAIPVPVDKPNVLDAIARMEQSLRPVDPRKLAVLLDKTMRLWRLPADWETVSGFYLEALEDLPDDLFEAALKRVRMTHKYPDAPKPADFRQAVEAELTARKLTVMRLKTAAMALSR